jgi:FkbM family methyltransferase
MIRDLGPYLPRKPLRLNGSLLTMLLNGLHDHHAGRVFVLQVGAGNGHGGLGLLPRFSGDNWSGLLIEPHPDHFAELETLHHDSDRIAILNLGISDISANLAVHALAPTANPRLRRGRASLIRDRLTGPGVTDTDIASTDVPFLRMDSVLGELGLDSAQLIAINAGGHEAQVLASFDLAALDPSLVLVDTDIGTTADDACIAALQAAGLMPFRIGEWLAGLAPDRLAVPMEELLTFLRKGVAEKEDEE